MEGGVKIKRVEGGGKKELKQIDKMEKSNNSSTKQKQQASPKLNDEDIRSIHVCGCVSKLVDVYVCVCAIAYSTICDIKYNKTAAEQRKTTVND